jgi:hypothetical protein
MSDSWHCEGEKCDEISVIYLDDNGITEDNPERKTFGQLVIGDRIYKLIKDEHIPSFSRRKVGGVSLESGDQLRFNFTGDYVTIGDKDSTEEGPYYIRKKDCEKALQELCMKRILRLSKVIGSIS